MTLTRQTLEICRDPQIAINSKVEISRASNTMLQEVFSSLAKKKRSRSVAISRNSEYLWIKLSVIYIALFSRMS